MTKVLITGGNGFLGKFLVSELQEKNYNVKTLGRTSSNDIVADIAVNGFDINQKFDFVIHAAGKAHVTSVTSNEKREFYQINVLGTINLLQSLEISGIPKSFIFISSVAVYGKQSGNMIDETHPLLAIDPYGASKIEAEFLISEWCLKNTVTCTILRLPLIAGPFPPGNLEAMISGIKKGLYFNIAGGRAKKSILLAEDITPFIINVLKVGGIYNLTDGQHPNIGEIAVLIAKQLNKPVPKSIPLFIARIFALIGDIFGDVCPLNSDKLNKLSCNLTFDDTKARKTLSWMPTPVLRGFKIE